ncbi:polysaccharide biosynthesis protein [Oceanobacillus caeni]|uniref:putative polysaccharide biosynthesis protein n=1 Tax=Oceanobacillus caeni TaxID=405946 RepID=UPI0006210C08|nr:polysaccharide biosynthesis protein [Oceanobacillus caeni]KKE79970.1 cell division protein [Bacilli bacterium VT-13-104]PZD83006.1 polysaccharide biosynthesis protein [Bacilli bacterium]MBU8792433.1 polysaccharide biosynthesis protein [Oceanobacillus caeni]MCR1835326.1 polysaccharide biosynthesis protein [Oceanobacillus caeni]PZD83760.1 polysaccharide biosynthesis protein [Bacilli bacterium]
MSNIVKGAFILTLASFLSKFLGMIYVIPFNALVGDTGGTLFSFAYTPYSIFISLSTVGIPVAVSKFVSKYNSLGDYETSYKMFKIASKIMAITGIVAFLVLFFSSEWLAHLMITSDDPVGITVEDVTFVTRMVSIALLIIPVMSISRGFFQGYETMMPTAVSQVIESIIRILFILVGSFVIIKVMGGSIVTAVGFSTFAAFIGALASCIVLYIYWKKTKPTINQQLEMQQKSYNVSTKELLVELFQYAGPFILVGLAIPLYQLVDQFTFERAMVASGLEKIWESAYAVINYYGHKIVIIPMTIATGLSLSILPTLTKSFTQKDRELLNNQINQALQIVFVLVIPAAAGMAILSNETYGALYGMNDIAGQLLAWYSPVVLLFGLFSVSAAILQGINEQRFAVISLLAGLLVKVLLNVQLIHWFGAKGAIFGTALASGIAVVLNLVHIKKSISFSYKQLFKRTILILIFTAIMVIAIWIVKIILEFIIPADTRMGVIIHLMVGVMAGGGVYLYLAHTSTLLERVLGKRISIDLIKRKRSR